MCAKKGYLTQFVTLCEKLNAIRWMKNNLQTILI